MKDKRVRLKEYQIDIIFFSILLSYMFFYLPEKSQLHGFCITPYFLRYSDFGFISRGFVGSILGIIFPYLSTTHIAVIIGINQIIMCLLIIWFLRIVRKKSDDNSRAGIIFLSLLFILNPSSVIFLFYWGNYGRFDLFMIVATTICCMLSINKKCNQNIKWILCICIVTILIHQGFVFSYFPCILSIVFVNLEKNKKSKISLLILFAVCSTVFLAMQFGGKISGYSLVEVMEMVLKHTDYPIAETSMIELEYFTPILNFIPVYVLPPLRRNLIKCILVIIVMLPLEVILWSIWNDFIKKVKKHYFLMPIFIIVATMPKFIITCDYGRDFASIFISEFLMIFTIFAMGNESMEEALIKFQSQIKRHRILAVLSVIELALIGKFEAANILEITEKIVSVIL